MRYLLFILLLINNISVSAQQRDTVEYLLDYWWKPCAPSKAMYYRMSYREGDIWHVKDYYLKEKTLQMDATALDDSCKKRHGMAFFYHPNGRLSEKTRYVNDTIEGLSKRYDSSGRLIDSVLFKKGIPWKFSYAWYSSGKLKYKGVYDDSGKGVGEEWYYYEDGTLSDHGYTTVGLIKSSVWTYYYRSGIISCKEYCNNGKILSKECYDESGNLMKGKCDDDNYEDWRRLLRKKLQNMKDRVRYGLSEEQRVMMQEVINANPAIILNFCVDENGNVSVTIVKGVNAEVDKILLYVLDDWPKLSPVKSKNRRVKQCMDMPLPLRD